jgi:predicted component of viral defense system (DUF524 family)
VSEPAGLDVALQGAGGTLRLLPLGGAVASSEVREGSQYAYRFLDLPGTVARIEPAELFEPDPDHRTMGRFRPRECVGSLVVRIEFDDGTASDATLEVRPVKLSYEREYRAMLDQIADYAAEALLQGFAPASRDIHPSPAAEGELRYRSLAFLLSRLRQPGFLAAIEAIRAHPNRSWAVEEEVRALGRGAADPAVLAAALRRSGGDVARPAHLAHLPSPHLPRRLPAFRTESTFDTPANRFVRFALRRWQGLALDVLRDLQRSPDEDAGPLRRGRREAGWLADFCEELLSLPLLRDAGELVSFPYGNQVLLRQAGYREVLRVFALAEATIALEAELPDDAFSATQRNVATLYEYWCFVTMVRAISEFAGSTPTGSLFESSANGLSLVLKHGSPSRLSWEVTIAGRVLYLDLWFNRSFARRAGNAGGSWSRAMRPDASLRIRPRTGRSTALVDPELDVWLHFDAKYRVEVVDVDESIDGDAPTDPLLLAKREDVLKMHAYRDAIRRSAGAYVLYPGIGGPELRREYHELLPGLGAFPLRPLDDGEIAGAGQLQSFLGGVAQHVANQASSMERAQYWSTIAHRSAGQRVRPVEFLTRPPADTVVLVGYVRAPQWPWVATEKLYNLRTGGRRGAISPTDDALNAPVVVLWSGEPTEQPAIRGVFERVGPWQLASHDDMADLGYPVRDVDAVYLLTPIQPLPIGTKDLVSAAAIEALRPTPFGSPFAVTWELLSRVALTSS